MLRLLSPRVVSKLRRAAVAIDARMMSSSGHIPDSGPRGFREREAAVENQYFNKEEERALRSVLKKLQSPQAVDVEKEQATKLLKKHGVTATPTLVDDLIKWKHSEH
mmetsp:Transcript_25007/g.41187  ORF Transcript_25007/g.41187 Transcript_25007/m.41187 type:complete len:107 (-) Transcript_25007:189-509(-)